MVKELFKLEVVEDKVVCKPLTERVRSMLNSNTSIRDKITKKINKQKEKHRKIQLYLQTLDLFTEAELDELRDLHCNLHYCYFYLTFHHDKIILSLNFCVDYGSCFSATVIRDSFGYDTEFTYDEFLSGGCLLANNKFIEASTLGGAHAWDSVSILTQKTDDLKNLMSVEMCLDSSAKSTLSIFDILDMRDKVKEDAGFLSYVKMFDSLSIEQAVKKFNNLLPKYEIMTSYSDMGTICIDLFKYGENKNISELLNVEDCQLLSMILGRLKRARYFIKYRIMREHKYNEFSKIEEIYLDVLSKHLGLSREDTVNHKLAEDGLAGLTFVKPETFHQFLESLKNEIDERYKEEREVEKARDEAIEKRSKQIDLIIQKVAEQLKTTDVVSLLDDLKNLENVPGIPCGMRIPLSAGVRPIAKYDTLEEKLARHLVSSAPYLLQTKIEEN